MRTIFTSGLLATCLAFSISSLASAGDDPSIKGKLRTEIQQSMQAEIKANTINGKFVVYDSVDGKLLKLKLDSLHSGIVKKGDFYVSCADLTDDSNKKYDLDFLVAPGKDGLKVMESVVHSVDGKKRKYHLED